MPSSSSLSSRQQLDAIVLTSRRLPAVGETRRIKFPAWNVRRQTGRRCEGLSLAPNCLARTYPAAGQSTLIHIVSSYYLLLRLQQLPHPRHCHIAPAQSLIGECRDDTVTMACNWATDSGVEFPSSPYTV